MSRSRKGNSAVNVELFPFLAVLMCTMGALILLLVAIARSSAQQAQAVAAAESGSSQAELQAARTNLLSRAAMLEQDRDMSAEELARRQAEIANLDELSRQLRQQLAELEAALANKLAPADEEDEALKAQIARLRKLIADTTLKLQTARLASNESANAFAIIPYFGPNGTRRRPIYIECRADSVILQPEGIVLSEADFPENALSLNPLSSGVQVAANYYERLAPPGEVEDPYPLLLVRPDGIGAYYAARAALKSWGADFGYEFVEQDWQLRYDPPNPRLAEMQKMAVQDARGKQRLMALANSGRGKDRQTGFRVAGSGGGMVRDDNGQPVKGEPGRGGRGGFGGGEFGGQPDGRGGGSGNFSLDGDQRGGFGSSGLANGRRGTSGPYGTSTSSGMGGNSNDDNGMLAGHASGPGQGSARGNATSIAGNSKGTALEAGSNSGARGASGDSASGNGESSAAASGGNAGNLSSGQTAGKGGQPAGSSGGGAAGGSPGGSSDAAAGPPGTASLKFGPPKEGSSSGEASKPGEYHEQLTREERRKLQSIAKKRGANWALPETPGSIALSRPIRIQCAADHLEIVPDRRGDRGIRRIDLGPRTEDAVPELVSGVSDQLNNWGIAGKGMYWRPSLQVEVLPGGEQRYEELAELLEGSGLPVAQKKARVTPRRTR